MEKKRGHKKEQKKFSISSNNARNTQRTLRQRTPSIKSVGEWVMWLSQSRTEYTLNPLKGLAWSELLAPEFIPRFSVGRYCLIGATIGIPFHVIQVPLSCILRYCSDHRHVSGRQGDRDWQRLGIILFRKDSILRSQANCAHTQVLLRHPLGTIYTRRLTIFCHCMTSSVICKYIAVVVDHLDSSFRMDNDGNDRDWRSLN